MSEVIEIRWHGRGGQGAWTASNILAMAAIKEGKFVQSFPTFGPERMGAPIAAFTRINDKPITLHCMIYEPDVVVVMDPTLLRSIPVIEGLKRGGKVVVNWEGEREELAKIVKMPEEGGVLYTVSATKIAMETLGRGITSTAMIGALLKATPVVKLESVEEAIRDRFPGQIADKNVEIVRKAHELTEMVPS